MPAKDIYHNAVKNALIQEGWIITNDPLHLKWGQKDMVSPQYIGERVIQASMTNQKN